MRLNWVRPIEMKEEWIENKDPNKFLLTCFRVYEWDENYPIYTPYVVNARDLYLDSQGLSKTAWKSKVIKEFDYNRKLICVRTDYPFSFLMVWYWSFLLKVEESWNEVFQKALAMLMTIWFPKKVKFEYHEELNLGQAIKKLLKRIDTEQKLD